MNERVGRALPTLAKRVDRRVKNPANFADKKSS